MRRSWRRVRRPGDEGSVLIFVLVFIVIGSLIVVPLLSYAISISRHNSVLSEKTRRQEAVKAGLRTALADPAKLYQYCADHKLIGGPGIDGIPVSNECTFLSFSLAEVPEDLHLGLAATRVGETVPVGLTAIAEKDADGNLVLGPDGQPIRYVYQPQTSNELEWRDPGAPYATSPVSMPKRIWLPNLPVHALNLRGPSGFDMPPEYPQCKVYFPGTYREPITVTGPTYFASGIYYFENTVTIAAGADVVVGMGQHLGCTTDQEAAFYATNAPAIHNISGLGGTFIFGHNRTLDTDGKLVVTNLNGSPRIRFNQRYVHEADTGGQPSFGVSIASVNGKYVSGPDAAGQYVISDLDVPGVNSVPFSLVGPEDEEHPPVAAGVEKYIPSRLTHEPRPPSPPRWNAATPLVALRTGTQSNDGAVRVRWDPPAQLGGQPVTQYLVTAEPGGRTCAPTTSPLECIVTGLTNGQAYTFTVTATNSIGTSKPSDESSPVTPRTSGSMSPLVDRPATPAAPTAVRYLDTAVPPRATVVVSWTAPVDNNSPIASYTIASNPSLDPSTHPCVLISTTSCMIKDLPQYQPGDPGPPVVAPADYVFTVTAANELGASITSPPSATSSLIPSVAGDPPPDPPVVPPVVTPPYEPEPIIDIDLPTTYDAVIDIPGYVSIPMGVFRLNNPNGLGTGPSQVSVTGGIVAAAFRVVDDRTVDGQMTVPIGLVNPIVQRTFRITSTTTSGTPKVTSTAIVQVNQNGAYAINSWVIN